MMRSIAWLHWVGAAAATLALAGCGGPDFEAICQDQEDCTDGNDKDVQACVAYYEMLADRADLQGCTDEFEVYVECYANDAKCSNKHYGLEKDACDDESNAYKHCDDLGDDIGFD
jgi:hypothetical protein